MKRPPKPSDYYDMLCGIETLHEYGISPTTREIYLSGEPESADGPDEPGVDYLMASRFIRNFRLLESQGNGPIVIHMKTCGGYEEEGFAIYDTIRLSKCHVTIVSYTHARSMSSIILQAADTRLLMPNSCVLLHWGTMELSGTHKQVLSNAEFAREREQRFLDVYIDAMVGAERFSDISRLGVGAFLRREIADKDDIILTAESALKWGLADAICTTDWRDM